MRAERRRALCAPPCAPSAAPSAAVHAKLVSAVAPRMCWLLCVSVIARGSWVARVGWVAHVSSACVLRLSHVTVAVTRCQLPRARRLSCMSVTCRLLCVSAVAREAVSAAVGIAV